MSTLEPATIHAATALGAIRLTVADLDRAQSFYERTIGLTTLDRSNGVARLGTEAGPLLELAGEPEAPPRPRGTTGLFHLALLVPTRADLATALRRVAESGWSFTGASDHLVSEALYLYDPEGNGIEIYRDRPRAEWRYVDGNLQMATEPLDLDGVMGELPAGGSPGPIAAGTRLGHAHLNVADIAAAEAFYGGVLGFDVTARGYPGALFLSAGGYHHHVGVNTWAGGDAPPRESRGLRWFEVVLPSTEELAAAMNRIEAAGIETEEGEHGIHVRDPSGNGVLLTEAGE